MLSVTCFCRVMGMNFELEVKATVTVVAQRREKKTEKKTSVFTDIGIFQSQNPYMACKPKFERSGHHICLQPGSRCYSIH